MSLLPFLFSLELPAALLLMALRFSRMAQLLRV
jgi:hypothetical protein